MLTTTCDQKKRDILNTRVGSLEKVVQEMARTIIVLQIELYNKEHITNNKVEADSNVVNVNKSLDVSTLEQISEDKNFEIKDGPLKCEHCDYKCKKVVTMKKNQAAGQCS